MNPLHISNQNLGDQFILYVLLGEYEPRHGSREAVEVCVHGDIGKDEPQREGTIPGTLTDGEEAEYEPRR